VKAGKAKYDLPMFVNAALKRTGRKPGEYPSGGPLPHLLDVWKAGAPSLDFLAPDIYFPNFAQLASRFNRADNVLFIPEANNATNSQGPANAFFAFGETIRSGSPRSRSSRWAMRRLRCRSRTRCWRSFHRCCWKLEGEVDWAGFGPRSRRMARRLIRQ
jgi:beta-galactosidase GanA